MTAKQQLQKVIEIQTMAALLFKSSSELRTILENNNSKIPAKQSEKQANSEALKIKFMAKFMKRRFGL